MKEIGNRVWKGCETTTIDAHRTTRGLAILWCPEEVNLKKFWATRLFFSVEFHICDNSIKGVLKFFYGPSIYPQKATFFEALSWETRWVRDK